MKGRHCFRTSSSSFAFSVLWFPAHFPVCFLFLFFCVTEFQAGKKNCIMNSSRHIITTNFFSSSQVKETSPCYLPTFCCLNSAENGMAMVVVWAACLPADWQDYIVIASLRSFGNFLFFLILYNVEDSTYRTVGALWPRKKIYCCVNIFLVAMNQESI